VDGELLELPQGMNIALTIRSKSDEHSRALLEAYRFPFRPVEEATVG
jgi:ribosomal protein L5